MSFTTSPSRRGFLGLATIAAGTLAAPAILRAQATATLADTLAGDSRFARFLDLITRAGMVNDFRAAQPLTVFAPIESAFLGAPQNLLSDLAGTSGGAGGANATPDRERLGALINYHIIPGAFRAAQLTGTDRRLRTKNGSDIAFNGMDGAVTLQNPAPGSQIGGFRAAGINVSATPARIVQADILASNGIIQAIDQVIWP